MRERMRSQGRGHTRNVGQVTASCDRVVREDDISFVQVVTEEVDLVPGTSAQAV